MEDEIERQALMATAERIGLMMDSRDDTNSKTIALWGDEELLAEAVSQLLVAKREWRLIRVSNAWSDETLVRELKRSNIDILIVSEGILASDSARLVRVVHDHPKLKIITINLDNNLLEVVNKQTVRIEEASDLLAIIEYDVQPQAKGGEIRNKSDLIHSKIQPQ